MVLGGYAATNRASWVARHNVWGQRRNGSTWIGAPSTPDKQQIANTTRVGFTGHEMLDTVQLVHMRGRVYDPVIGRFLSADPVIGDLADSQQVNPYAYVGNRPLSYTDPTGRFGVQVIFTSGDTATTVVRAGPYVAAAYVAYRFFKLLFGHSKPPPPPASAIAGLSAQRGTGPCGPGSTGSACRGAAIYANAPIATGEGSLSSTISDIAIDIVVGSIPGVGQVIAVKDAYEVFVDPNATWWEKGIAVAGVLPGGKILKAGERVLRAVKKGEHAVVRAEAAARTTADSRRVAEQRAKRAARRERQSREGAEGAKDAAGNNQKPSGEGYRDHESASQGPAGERPAGPNRRNNRERNVGIDEEHSRRPKGGFQR